MLEKIKLLYKKCKPEYKKYALTIEKTIDECKKFGEIDPAFRQEFIQIIEHAKNLIETWNSWCPVWKNNKDWTVFKELYKEIYHCEKCDLDSIRRNKNRLKVPGAFTDNEKALPIMVISEAPGYYEETTSWDFNGLEFGYPFQGKAGKTFQKMCDLAQIDRFDLYITNLLKCSDKNEEVKDIIVDSSICYSTCFQYIEQQILLYKPVIIWTLGSVANSFIDKFLYDLEDKTGDTTKISYGKNTKSVILTQKYMIINNAHPAYISRKEKDYWFIRKERGTIELLKIIINIFKENNNV